MFPNPGKHISKYFFHVEGFKKNIILGYTTPQEQVRVMKLRSTSSWV
jgi:hypothetical protein